MTVIVLIAAAQGLRGHLTRWMIEVSAGVYVGNPSARVRDRLWTTLTTRIHDGQAIMIERASTEQGWTTRTTGTNRWHPIDFDGLTLIARPRTRKAPDQSAGSDNECPHNNTKPMQ